MNHEILDWLIAGCGLGWLILQLFTNGKVSDIKTDIAETNGLIKEHIAADKGTHERIDQHFEFVDQRVTNLERKRGI